jgi:hypothetical protein
MLEAVGGNVFGYGEVLGGGLEVLAEGEDIATGVAEVPEGLEEFRFGFAEAEHEAGLGLWGRVSGAGFDFLEETEGAVVGGAVADGGGEASDGFEVMVEDVGPAGEDGIDGFVEIVEIRGEDLEDGVGVALADGFEGEAEVVGAAVGKVIAGDGGDDDMAELEAGDGFGDPSGLVGFEGEGFGGGNGAEAARAGAAIAGDHEGGGGAAPAFPVVGATGAFADGMEAEFIEEATGAGVGLGGWELDAEPLGESGSGGGGCVGWVGGDHGVDGSGLSFCQNSWSSRGPKSASTCPSTSMTGARVWLESRTISW